jgi:PhnB protein
MMKTIQPYLLFDGTCAEAMRFYERTLSGKLSLVAAKDAPAGQMPPGAGDRTIHAHLDADNAVLMASDWLSPDPYPGMAGFSVTLIAPTAADAKALFDELAAGGNVTMPFEKTFYADGFGMLVDRFGTPWMVMSESNTPS